jgi:1,4-dihydroxy-2-naphthoate octaprenyltransferase
MAVALLVVNNLRDIPGDTVAGKRTLAVRIGAPATRRLYEGCVVLAVLVVIPLAVMRPWSLLGLAAFPFALVPVRAVASGADGPALIPVLGATGRAQLVLGVLLAVGLAL